MLTFAAHFHRTTVISTHPLLIYLEIVRRTIHFPNKPSSTEITHIGDCCRGLSCYGDGVSLTGALPMHR